MPGKRAPGDVLAQMRTEYVTGSMSYSDLAKKHGVARSTIAKLARREGWVQERAQYRTRVVTTAVSKRARADSDKLARLMAAADRACVHVDELFADPDQFRRYVVQEGEDGDYHSVERVFDKRDAAALRNAVAALRELTTEVRDLYRLPTLQQEQAQEIAVQRLNMDRDKAEGKDLANTITVRFKGLEDVLTDGPGDQTAGA